MNSDQLFIFNSCLPERGQSAAEVLRSLGPSQNRFRGRNIGNGYISYAILKILFGAPAKVPHLPNAWEDPLPPELADRINQTCTHFLFSMQDFLRVEFSVLPFDRINQFLERIRIPIVPFSLGANALPGHEADLPAKLSDDQRRFMSLLAEKSARIGVRGEFTADVFERLGIHNVQVLGCPSFFESGPTRIIEKRPWDPRHVVTTGSFYNRGLPHSLHMLQDEKYFIDLLWLYGEPDHSDDSREAQPLALESIGHCLNLFSLGQQGRLRFFFDISEWERFYSQEPWCLTVGTRLHSGIMSCNRGVPAIVTSGDSRSRETCRLLQIPWRPDLGSVSDLAKEYEELDLSAMNAAYPRLYAGLVEYLQAHRLSAATTPAAVEPFPFPHVLRRSAEAAMQAGFSDSIQLCERTVQGLQHTIEKQNLEFEARHQQDLAALEGVRHELLVSRQETASQAAESARSRAESEQRRLELEAFKVSTAGRIAIRLQSFHRRFPRLGKVIASLLRS